MQLSESTLRGLSRGTDIGSCFLDLGKRRAKRTFPNCPQIKIWGTEFVGKKLLNVNSELLKIFL